MLRVGLTGGIGSGKTTVAAGLSRRGAALIDADRIAREVVQPGGPAYDPLVERFGAGVLQPDGTLDRPKLAAIVFSDADALAALNAITHPAIGAVVRERLAELTAVAGPGGIVVLDQPLLTPQSAEAYRLDVIVVVDTPAELAVTRLVRHRGFSEADARARIAAQIDREARLRLADLVIDNSGGIVGLEEQVDRVWADLVGRARPQPGTAAPPGAAT